MESYLTSTFNELKALSTFIDNPNPDFDVDALIKILKTVFLGNCVKKHEVLMP
jgi:hypothetical protein